MPEIYFDVEAGNYDSWYMTRRGEWADIVETKTVFELLMSQKGMRILDAGCGTGNYSIKLARLDCQVAGIDISGNMIDIARNPDFFYDPALQRKCFF